jgi:hypothetical protein
MMPLTRRYAAALWLLLCLATPSWAVLPAGGVWECRGTGTSGPGLDTNGGGIDAALVVTDYSQSNTPILSETDLATTGVVTTLTSATGGFTAAMVGNYIHINSGTNFTVGWYEITARASSNSVTLDRAPSTAAGVAGVGSVGGALATLGTLSGAMVASNKAFCTGVFTANTATAIVFNQTVTPSATAPMTRLIGYGSTRGDSVHATLALTTNTGQNGIFCNGNGISIEQVDIDCASLGTSVGIMMYQYGLVRNCKVANFTTRGIVTASVGYDQVIECEVTGGIAGAAAAIDPSSAGGAYFNVLRCNVHDNACVGIKLGNDQDAIGNLVTNNSGGLSDGIVCTHLCKVLGNTIHGNGRDGIRMTTSNLHGIQWRNNILTNNGGFGINNSSGTDLLAMAETDGNAYYLNTGGARGHIDSVAGIFGVNSYVNTRDVILSASPFIGPTTGSTANFGLNGVAGGGAACKGKGSPGTWPGNTGSLGSLDMGAVQSAGAKKRIEIIH